MAKTAELLSVLTMISQTLDDAFYVKDRAHRWVIVNDAFCNWVGVQREHLIGKTEDEIFLKEIASITREDESQIFKIRKPSQNESRIRDPEGREHTIQTRRSTLQSDEGDLFVLGIIRDDSRLKTAERKLQESEQKHEIIFDRAPIGIAYLGHSGRIKTANQRFCAILGYSVGELQDQNYGVIAHPDESWTQQVFPRIFGGHAQHVRLESKARRKDGAELEVALWISGVRTDGSKVDSAVVVMEEIGERKRIERLMQSQRDILELVARNPPLKTIAEHIVQWVSKHLGGEVGSSLCLFNSEKNQLKLLSSAGLPTVLEKWLIAGIEPGLDTGSSGAAIFSQDTVICTEVQSDFRWTPVEDSVKKALGSFRSSWSMPIFATDGTILGTLDLYLKRAGEPNETETKFLQLARHLAGIALERKRADQMILDQQVKLFSSSRMVTLGEMAGGIAHEINNPLAVIHGRAGVLRDAIHQNKYDAKLFDESIERIEDTAMRIAKIIRGLRAFAREGSGDPFQATNVLEIVADTMEFCRSRFKSNQIELLIEAPENPDLQCDCRAVQIGQVLLNLLNNAFDAVQNLPQPWVKLAVRERGDYVEFSITDSGPGIPEEVREKIMEPFFTTKEVGKGTGLGLSIVKGIVESHRGSIHIASDSANTCFVVTFPKNQPAYKLAAA